MAAKKKSNKPSISKEPPYNPLIEWDKAKAVVNKANQDKLAMQAQGTKDLKAYQQAKIAEYEASKSVRLPKIQDIGKGGVSYTERSSGSSVMRNLFRFGSGGPLNRGK